MRGSKNSENGMRQWLGWSAFVGFTGLGLIVGSSVYYLTVKLNPHLARGFANPFILYLYSTLFYGIIGSAVGLLLGLLFWKFVSGTGSIRRVRLLKGVIMALLVLGPIGWTVSTSQVSLSLYTLKGKLLHMSGLWTSICVIAVLMLLIIFGYAIVGQLSKIPRPPRMLLAIYPLTFLLTLAFIKGFYDGSLRGTLRAADVDYGIRGSGIKFIIIGLDCADWDVIDPLAKEGKLPALSRLREEGVSADLRTMIPTLSPSLWTSISTGMSPEKHGVRNFYITSLPFTTVPIRLFPGGFGLNFRIIPFLNNSGLAPGLIRMNTSNMKGSPDIWNIFSRFNQRVGVIDYMITWPAEEINGFMVSDLLLRYVHEFGLEGIDDAKGLFYPQELAVDLREILEGIVPGRINLDHIRGKLVSGNCELSEQDPYVKLLTKKLWRDESLWALCRELYHRYEPDLLVNYTSAIDGTNHVFGKFIYTGEGAGTQWECFNEVLSRWYQYEDARILELMEMADDSTCIIVLSDHGWDEEKGHHENGPEGILIMWGAGVKKGVRLESAGLMDVVPTVLSLAGYPVARDMEGEILEEAIREEILEQFPPCYVQSYAEEEVGQRQPVRMDPVIDRQIREELEALGYIK